MLAADHMDPDYDEVQVAWEDGTVENVRCRDLLLGKLKSRARNVVLPFYSFCLGALSFNYEIFDPKRCMPKTVAGATQ